MADELHLVTGGGGFIGGHLVAALQRNGQRVRAVDHKPLEHWAQRVPGAECIATDLSDPAQCRRVTAGVHRVYQLAADMGGMGFIEHNKALCMLSVLTNTNMLLAAREAGVSRFFYASSACVYNVERQASAEVTALREEDAYPAMPEDGYGWEKLFSERMCRHFHEDFGVPIRIARYHNVYGPLGPWDGGREKAPAAICRKVIEAAASGVHEIEIWGDGSQTRSFMYIDDCITGTLAIADSAVVNPLNLGSSELVTIDQLVDLAERFAGIRLRRRYRLDAPLGVRGRNSDNTAIHAALGWEPGVRLADGLERTYRWIHDEYHTRHRRRSGVLPA